MAAKDARVDPVKVPGSFVRLQGAYSGLRAAEQRVADFILKHPDELIYLTVTELAERTNTSESTVVRLCQKIGYKGYQEFKIVLARDLVGPATEIYAAIEPGDDLATVKAKVFQANAQALRDTLEVLDDVQLQKGRRCNRRGAAPRDLRRRRERSAGARCLSQVPQVRPARGRLVRR
jgi:hypothetical protein